MLTVAVSVPARDRSAFPQDAATWPCVEEARRVLAEHGIEAVEFRASGAGGRELEEAVARGRFAGVLELTTTELAEALVEGAYSAGPDRLTAAALHGVPQVIVPGALDRVNFAADSSLAARTGGRRSLPAGAGFALLRTTPEENDSLGREIALKASAARGPTAVLLPLGGLSALDSEGQPFWWPAADQALFQSVRNWISPEVLLDELDLHVNNPQFAREVIRRLLELLARRDERAG